MTKHFAKIITFQKVFLDMFFDRVLNTPSNIAMANECFVSHLKTDFVDSKHNNLSTILNEFVNEIWTFYINLRYQESMLNSKIHIGDE